MNLQELPQWPQRQDSVAAQLADLRRVANRLGFYDAADAIAQWCKNLPELKYGCYCDLKDHMEPDGCVIDDGEIHNCVYAQEDMRKEQCEYWRPIQPKDCQRQYQSRIEGGEAMKFSEMTDPQFADFLEFYRENHRDNCVTKTDFQIVAVLHFLRTGERKEADLGLFDQKGLVSIFGKNQFMIDLMAECNYRYAGNGNP